jgi:N-acetylmuramoyl-L-alanine amidase CwlA
VILSATDYLKARPGEESRLQDRARSALLFAQKHAEKMHIITNAFLAINKYSRPGVKRNKILGVVVHYTAARGGIAEAVKRYFDRLEKELVNQDGNKENDRYASAHYVVGLAGEILRMIPDNEKAWGVGALQYRPGVEEALGLDPNNTTISIEMCIDKAGAFPQETEAGAAWLSSWLLDKYRLSEDNLYRHHDITGKLCPAPYVYDEKAWLNFKTMVRRRLAVQQVIEEKKA